MNYEKQSVVTDAGKIFTKSELDFLLKCVESERSYFEDISNTVKSYVFVRDGLDSLRKKLVDIKHD